MISWWVHKAWARLTLPPSPPPGPSSIVCYIKSLKPLLLMCSCALSVRHIIKNALTFGLIRVQNLWCLLWEFLKTRSVKPHRAIEDVAIKRMNFIIGAELSCLSEREFNLHSLPPSRGLKIRSRSSVSFSCVCVCVRAYGCVCVCVWTDMEIFQKFTV